MIRTFINGVNGRIGKTLVASIKESVNMEVAAGVDIVTDMTQYSFPVYASLSDITVDGDVIIDFSSPQALQNVLQYAADKFIPAVLATTGYTDSDKALIADYADRIPLFSSANMSLGVNLQIMLSKKAAGILGGAFDIEIIEKHHNHKADAPSGTALVIADSINSEFNGTKKYVYGRRTVSRKRTTAEIGIHAVRGGTVAGEHDVLFLGHYEVIEINHRAHSKQVFALGAIRAAQFMINKPAGLYSMNDLFADVF